MTWTLEHLCSFLLQLEGTVEAPHFERRAFKVRRIYATIRPGSEEINILLDPGWQIMQCQAAPDHFRPATGGWGARGWTAVSLPGITEEVLKQALVEAWKIGRERDRSVGGR